MTPNPPNDLLEYFKKNLAKGYTINSLKIALVKQGYSHLTIDNTIRKVHENLAKKAPEFKEKPKIKYEVLDEDDKPIKIKKSFWRKFF